MKGLKVVVSLLVILISIRNLFQEWEHEMEKALSLTSDWFVVRQSCLLIVDQSCEDRPSTTCIRIIKYSAGAALKSANTTSDIARRMHIMTTYLLRKLC